MIGGGVNLLAAGQTASTAITASLASTATAGLFTGSALLILTSDGSGTSGLGLTNLSTLTLQSSVSVYRYANGVLSNNPVSFGNVHMNDTVSQFISISNEVPNDGFSESLDGSLTLVNAPGSFAGNFGQLVTGGTTSVTASLNTTAASGISSCNPGASDGAGSGSPGGITPRSTITLSSTGIPPRRSAGFYHLRHLPQRIGDAVSALIDISNADPADGYSESLDGTLSGVTDNEFTGNFLLLSAGQTTSITTTFNTMNAVHHRNRQPRPDLRWHQYLRPPRHAVHSVN